MEYDGWADRYDEDTQRFGWCAPQRLVAAAREHVPAFEGLDVLDLGVGTGQCSAPFVDAGARVVGIDAAPTMLERAAERGAFDALHALVLGEAPLASAIEGRTFDVVLSCGVLHFVADLAGLLAEVRPLVRKGGVLCMTTIPPQSRSLSAATHVRTTSEVRSTLERADFSVADAERFIAYWAEGRREDPVYYDRFSAHPAG